MMDVSMQGIVKAPRSQNLKEKLKIISIVSDSVITCKIRFMLCNIEECKNLSVVEENLRPFIIELKDLKIQLEIVEEMLAEKIITPLLAAMSEIIVERSDRVFNNFWQTKYNNLMQSITHPIIEVDCRPEAVVTIGEVFLNEEQKTFDFFKSAKKFLEDHSEKLKGFLQSAESKKLRLAFQKAINLPINTLTVGSGDELMEKYKQLKLVFEKKAPTGIESHPGGVDFCKNLFAKAVLQQGEKLVSNKPEMAFGLAALIVALCSDFPYLTELLLAYFRTSCPYLCPIILDQSDDQTEDEYKRTLGYKIIDETVEKQGHYLNRMSGIIKLYAAIIVAKLRHNENGYHPHGLENAWRLLNAILKCKPTPEHVDALATVIRDILQVCGPAMEIGAEGPIGRLRILLETFSTDGSFPEPKGQLPNNFW
ncbi:hypothetical protein KQX54_004581 [Cotesia glomerata]|uniref:mRNA export factor GLE1 n=1 Tax=Cotesia glomerata TaxID=32391 RepID=A0AAV7IPI2_COTGL|nr:hypothetical protein KQX54_004581 [Cotesia glomerata]